jgi:hypothetical protein
MNEKPQHGLCPNVNARWCKFKKSASPGLAYQHMHCLLATVVDLSKPVFRDLAIVGLLKRCLCGKTQNHCECLNSVIWTMIHKTVFVRLDTLAFGLYDAVLCFNDGVAKKIVMS